MSCCCLTVVAAVVVASFAAGCGRGIHPRQSCATELLCCKSCPFVAFCITLVLAPIQNSLCGPAIPSSHGRSMIVSSTLSFTISCILKGPIRSSYLGQIYPVTAAHGMTSVSLSIGLCFQLVYIQYIHYIVLFNDNGLHSMVGSLLQNAPIIWYQECKWSPKSMGGRSWYLAVGPWWRQENQINNTGKNSSRSRLQIIIPMAFSCTNEHSL